MGGRIGTRHGEIEGRQPVRFVLDVEQLLRDPPVLGPQAPLLTRLVVLPVEDAVRSLEEPVFVQHGHQSPGCEIADRRSFRLPVLAESAQSSKDFPSLGKLCWQIRWQTAHFEAFRCYVTL